MFKLFRRTPTASEMGKRGAAVKKHRNREGYKTFHDNMAAKCGRRIEWAE